MPATKPKKKAPSHLASRKTRRVRGIRSRVNNLKLQGTKFETLVKEPLDATISRTIEGASTIAITVDDPSADFLRSKLLESRIDVELDGLWFRSVRLEKVGPQFTLTFEDREVALMRMVTEPQKWLRDQYTRAEAVYSMVQEAWQVPGGYEFATYIPHLHKIRPIANSQDAQTAQVQINTGDAKGAKGLDRSANITVGGAPATEEQLKNIEICLQVGASLNAPEDAMVAIICAGTQENGMTNVNHGSACMNLFCVTTAALPVVQAAGADVSDVAANAHIMYTRGFWHAGLIESVNKGLSPGDAAQQAEGSAYPSLYAQHEAEARKTVAAFNGGDIAGISGSTTYSTAKQYAFELKPEDKEAWTATGRLADEVHFRRFMSAAVFYYLAETELLTQKPLLYIDGDTKGIDNVDFAHDHGQPVQEISFTGDARQLALPPASLIKLNEDWGPAAGGYLVHQIDGNMFNDQVTVTANKPMAPLPEPAPETTTKTVDFGESGTMGTTSSSSSDLSSLDVTSTPGAPHWGGSADVMEQFVYPIARKHGLTPGATKEGGHTQGGDHDPANTTGFATDFPTSDGESFAREVAGAFGNSGIVHSYTWTEFTAGGKRFRSQVLWDLSAPQPGPGDYAHRAHVHVGIEAL